MPAIPALIRKDLHAWRNIGILLRRESRFKVGFILFFATGMTYGLFRVFLDGFHFLADLGGAGFMVTRYLFSLCYFALGIMLVLSGIITSYSTIFRSREVPYLMTSPFTIRDIVSYKFIESCLLSSWAFFFIIIPFAGAYAWHEKMPVLFPLWTLLFSIPFLVLCSGLGTLLALLLVRWLPRGRIGWFFLIAGAAAIGGWAVFRHPRTHGMDDATFILNNIVPGLQIASWPLAPNWWTAEGIMSLTRGQYGRGVMLWGVLCANMLMVFLLVQTVGGMTFDASWQRLVGTVRRARRHSILLPGLARFFALFGRETRGLVMKDIRTFLRDPMQWSQALIFFGLLGFYFASLRSFHYNTLPPVWRNMIAFLNVFSVSAVLCSLASRFFYPQLSLEGHGFWVLGLSPVGMRRILWTKFVLSLAAMLLVSTTLMFLSTHMLQVDPLVKLVAIALAASISTAVCGLSAGLGAVFMDLKQSNPVAIVSGFGGTVNLVLSLLYMCAAIIPFALTFHFYFTDRTSAALMHHHLILAAVWLLVITIVTTLVPLYAGRRSLQNRDY